MLNTSVEAVGSVSNRGMNKQVIFGPAARICEVCFSIAVLILDNHKSFRYSSHLLCPKQ
jgi:hypothetical protein